MNETLPFFDAVEVRRVPEPPLPECAFPYVVMAYWPRGGFWSVRPQMFTSPDCESIEREIADLHAKGWVGIKVVKLP